MNILTLDKQRNKMKVWYFKMPNFSYCPRYRAFERKE